MGGRARGADIGFHGLRAEVDRNVSKAGKTRDCILDTALRCQFRRSGKKRHVQR